MKRNRDDSAEYTCKTPRTRKLTVFKSIDDSLADIERSRALNEQFLGQYMQYESNQDDLHIFKEYGNAINITLPIGIMTLFKPMISCVHCVPSEVDRVFNKMTRCSACSIPLHCSHIRTRDSHICISCYDPVDKYEWVNVTLKPLNVCEF